MICDLLVAGGQAILLRKGGIEEADGPGRFRLETPRFAPFPAWLHQRPERIKSKWREQVRLYDCEPDEIEIRGVATAEHVWQVSSRESLAALDEWHAWTDEQLDMRWNYKPHQPLFLLAARVSQLKSPRTTKNNLHYAGCKSWIDLDAGDAIDDANAIPVLTDEAFAKIVTLVDAAMNSDPH